MYAWLFSYICTDKKNHKTYFNRKMLDNTKIRC